METGREWVAALVLAVMLAVMAFLGGIMVGWRAVPRGPDACHEAIVRNYKAWLARGVDGFAETWPDVEKHCLRDIQLP